MRKGGERFFANVVLTALFDERGVLRGFGKVIRDITDRRENEARLVYLADHDPLTGLVNRRRFEQDVDERLVVARRAGLPLSVLFIDLDNFKYVNDTFGHQAGDQLIRLAGGAITRCLRDADVLARLGGDEFGVVLGPGAGADAGLRAADRIRAALSREDLLGVADRPVRLTASVGVATVSEGEGLIATEALTRADIAMYEAKAAGRDTSIVYTPSGRTRMQAAQGMVGRLRHTLEHNLLTLHAQPIIAVATGDVTGYELLVRMPAEDGSLLAAGAFIPIAERFGMVGEIDRWVVTSAILLAAELQSANPMQSLAVNLSGGSIGDPELLELITAELAHTGVDPARLTFEITETAAIANMDDAVEFARRLTRLGCRFALDDFGAGFGSYYYLKHLPVDTVKIDGEFVRSLASSPTDRVLVKAMVDVAHGLERTATAEFVENEDTMQLLRDFGVDHAQGYHLGRPAPVADVLAALASARRGATSGDMP